MPPQTEPFISFVFIFFLRVTKSQKQNVSFDPKQFFLLSWFSRKLNIFLFWLNLKGKIVFNFLVWHLVIHMALLCTHNRIQITQRPPFPFRHQNKRPTSQQFSGTSSSYFDIYNQILVPKWELSSSDCLKMLAYLGSTPACSEITRFYYSE